MSPMIRTAPRYDMLFGEGIFNGTLLIGPDPPGAGLIMRFTCWQGEN